ncbi:class I SAM-dependent methyltransferase [Planktothrix sp. FACHB-1355]|uniref:Class I SAM-dependent methyltransferase n=1 Tax=Aerosakkonema funiforme FACHB-1375 TaxID=2949571 RepID=A0A926VH09_9CYAN|nr:MULTISPECIES: class I SAM-dependent methyltransferase [Oscillatoriales]MBD2183568.1 class I SAM-dependent methyltransferase [Aerosakkonema funiforme FACHB-1375]MBD3559575.1 class I SAM-dependent methyltransferase [Planktothrix sp. FACHB-1355]
MPNTIAAITTNVRSFLWNNLPWLGNFVRSIKGNLNKFEGGTDHVPSQVVDVLERYSQLIGDRNFPVTGKVCLELGTGNSPDIAFLMLLAGASRSIMVDTEPFMKVPFQEGKEYEELVSYLRSIETDRIKFPQLTAHLNGVDLNEIARRLEYVNYDGVHLPLPDASVDIIYSKSVLEHVREPAQLFQELRRISKPEAIHLHIVDLRDHFHIKDDNTVNGNWLEFLEYDEEAWARRCVKTHGWCNRLRLPSWYPIVQESGFAILQENIVRIPLPTQSLPDTIKSVKDLDAAWWWVLLQPQGSKT